MTDMNNTKNQSSGGIADDANVYDIEEDRRSIDSFYNTDNDEAMCLAAAQIAEEFEKEKEEEEKRKAEEKRERAVAKMEMMPTSSSSSSSIVVMPSQSAIFHDSRSKEEMAKEITDLKAELNQWKGKAIYLEFEVTKLEKENKKMYTEMANAKNESIELRGRIEKEQQERDKEMEHIRTAMRFQEEAESAARMTEATFIGVGASTPIDDGHQQEVTTPPSSIMSSPPLRRHFPRIRQQQQLPGQSTLELEEIEPSTSATTDRLQLQLKTSPGPVHGYTCTSVPPVEQKISSKLFVDKRTFPSPTEAFGEFTPLPKMRRRKANPKDSCDKETTPRRSQRLRK